MITPDESGRERDPAPEPPLRPDPGPPPEPEPPLRPDPGQPEPTPPIPPPAPPNPIEPDVPVPPHEPVPPPPAGPIPPAFGRDATQAPQVIDGVQDPLSRDLGRGAFATHPAQDGTLPPVPPPPAPPPPPGPPPPGPPTPAPPTPPAPTHQQPAYQQPTHEPSTYQQPMYQQPTYQHPTYQPPASSSPGAGADSPWAAPQNHPQQNPIPPVPQVTTPGSSTWNGPAAGTGGAQVPAAPGVAAGAGAAAAGYDSGGGAPPPGRPVPPANPPPGTVYGGGPGGGKQNLFGWLSFIFAIIGTGCCCCPWLNGAPFVGGIPAVVLGILHLNKVKKGEATMSWLAWVGIILGIIAIIGGVTSLATDWNDRLRDEYSDMTN